MRSDAVGFFWNDAPVPRPPRPGKVKRTPPERVWERPDYLPGLEEALRFPVDYFDDYSLMSEIGGRLVYDIECYTNFFQVAFMSLKTGKVIDFIMTPDCALDTQRLVWIAMNFTIIGFNSRNYDLPMLSLAAAGYDNDTLKKASDEIIVFDVNASDLLKRWKVKKLKCDHIDLIEVAPLRASLKSYAGRMHTPKMQDLPVHPSAFLTPNQMAIVRFYCVNDLVNTAFLDSTLSEQLALRDKLSLEHGVDLRSKSDAQIAETVIGAQLQQRNGSRPQRPEIPIGTVYRYNAPSYLAFSSETLQQALELVKNTMFIVDHTGSVGLPPEFENLQLQVGRAKYTLRIGGLHSCEKNVCHRAVGGYRIFEIDVESYYPRIILNLGLYPQHLGPAFVDVFNQIVERRLAAKRAGEKSVADSLKITINGTYGKLGSQYSMMYAPDLLIQVTMTGQLSLLLLIELLEIYGIEVISANTDGIAIKCRNDQVDLYHKIVKFWEHATNFKTEENEYAALYSKDVNNYIAIKTDGKAKLKGEYSNPWGDKKNIADRLKKNPCGQISVEAVLDLLSKQVPIEETIRKCTDITKFAWVRHVSGGAVKDGIYLGKSIRWYYSNGQTGEIISAKTGNKVPRTDGATPMMVLPATFPDNVNYDWYVARSEQILKDIGYYG